MACAGPLLMSKARSLTHSCWRLRRELAAPTTRPDERSRRPSGSRLAPSHRTRTASTEPQARPPTLPPACDADVRRPGLLATALTGLGLFIWTANHRAHSRARRPAPMPCPHRRLAPTVSTLPRRTPASRRSRDGFGSDRRREGQPRRRSGRRPSCNRSRRPPRRPHRSARRRLVDGRVARRPRAPASS